MAHTSTKSGMKFRRFIYRFGKYSMFFITAITSYHITKHLIELRREKIRKERIKKNIASALGIISGIAAIVVGAIALLKYIEHLRKGYLFDLFDGDSYDVIAPDEESVADSMIRGELSYNDDAGSQEHVYTNLIPLDEEATEDDYK